MLACEYRIRMFYSIFDGRVKVERRHARLPITPCLGLPLAVTQHFSLTPSLAFSPPLSARVLARCLAVSLSLSVLYLCSTLFMLTRNIPARDISEAKHGLYTNSTYKSRHRTIGRAPLYAAAPPPPARCVPPRRRRQHRGSDTAAASDTRGLGEWVAVALRRRWPPSQPSMTQGHRGREPA
jgi:hypothetical protein